MELRITKWSQEKLDMHLLYHNKYVSHNADDGILLNIKGLYYDSVPYEFTTNDLRGLTFRDSNMKLASLGECDLRNCDMTNVINLYLMPGMHYKTSFHPVKISVRTLTTARWI
jgi:uncharacterized protein YjbI with pentapeptide repeats